MKISLAIFALLFSMSVHAINTSSNAVCWNDSSDEVDCATKVYSIIEQAEIDDEDDCTPDEGRSCHEFLVQHSEDCQDKNGANVDECVFW